ncbi:hypothetical protein PLESTB_001050200 [Pleodorina starrii]|uniref:Uncharacterized protein n=1 Tax=Pleodorina starrii TaxID=330485 RepID=A0A9W6BPN5_9CHLO|nr:hypothetical protein PLESTB_001050200 [Pleodorina starrii]
MPSPRCDDAEPPSRRRRRGPCCRGEVAAVFLLVLAFEFAAAVVPTALAAEPAVAGGDEGWLRGRRALRQEAEQSSEQPGQIPPVCLNTGAELQSSCSDELALASKAFGLNTTDISTIIQVNLSQLQNYLKTAPTPSAECCGAAKAFNDAYCSCNEDVLELAKSFTNNDIRLYVEAMFRSTKASRRSLSTAAFTLAVSTAVLALAVASTALAAFGADGSRRGLRAQPSPAIPNECINTGLDLQSSCTRELEMASQTFGLSPTADVGSIRVNMETLRTYLKTAPAPTAGCCAAAQAFNNVVPITLKLATVVAMIFAPAAPAAAALLAPGELHSGCGRRCLRQQPPPATASDGGLVPPECIYAGLNLQASCTHELELASKAFGLSPTSDISLIKVDFQQLRDYLQKAPDPSAGCCGAAQIFNDAYCGCCPVVLELIKSFTNNDVEEFYEVAYYLGERCPDVGKPFTLYMGDTCPK